MDPQQRRSKRTLGGITTRSRGRTFIADSGKSLLQFAHFLLNYFTELRFTRAGEVIVREGARAGGAPTTGTRPDVN